MDGGDGEGIRRVSQACPRAGFIIVLRHREKERGRKREREEERTYPNPRR